MQKICDSSDADTLDRIADASADDESISDDLCGSCDLGRMECDRYTHDSDDRHEGECHDDERSPCERHRKCYATIVCELELEDSGEEDDDTPVREVCLCEVLGDEIETRYSECTPCEER